MVKNLLISVAFSVTLGLVLAVSPAQALTLIPPSLEVDLTPGNVYTDSIKLFNETDHDVTLYTEITNFTASEDGSKPKYEFGLELTDVATWIQIESGPIVLAPKERKDVTFNIDVPADAEAGGHYAIIFFSDNPPQKQESGRIQIGSKIGTLILSNVAGEINEAGSIQTFTATGDHAWYSRLPVSFAMAFQNTGNVHLRPAGTVAITNTFGKTVATLDMNADGSATLPNSTRTYQTTWEKSAVVSTETNWVKEFWQEIKNEQANFAIGRYTAAVSVAAGANDQIVQQAEFSFWVIPWRLLTVAVLAGLVILLLGMRLIKGYNRWIIRRGQSS